jgi:GNAT superfamily N-acetyltransferase
VRTRQQAIALLASLADALGKHVKAALKIHADDIPIPALSPGNGKTKTERLWTYVRDDRPWADLAPPAVWFKYSPDRKGERPLAHLKDYHGILQADGYAGFNRLCQTGRVIESLAGRRCADLFTISRSPATRRKLSRKSPLAIAIRYALMYVHPAHQDKGVASALLEPVESFARRHRLAQLSTEASITARPFFEHRGFRLIA